MSIKATSVSLDLWDATVLRDAYGVAYVVQFPIFFTHVDVGCAHESQLGCDNNLQPHG